MIKRTLSSLVFIIFAVFALWIVGISSGVIGRTAKTVDAAMGEDVIVRAVARQALPAAAKVEVSSTAESPAAPESLKVAPSLLDAPVRDAETDISTQVKKLVSYSTMPLYFVQNAGQVDSKFKYYEQGSNHATYFAPDGVYMVLSKNGAQQTAAADSRPIASKPLVSETIKLTPLRANESPEIVAEAKLEGIVNYYIGNDPKAWKEGLATYQSVRYSDMYPGVDVRYYGDNSQLVYDVIVKPGADPRQVQFQYEGIQDMRVNANGELEVALAQGNITQKKPFIYQEVNGQRVAVDGQFKLLADEHNKHAYGFQIAAYDTSRELVIDPTIVYSTYHGGTGTDVAYGVAVDATGIAYYTGSSTGSFPTTTGLAFAGGTTDVFVTRRLASGAISWTTYFGGSGSEVGRAIALSTNTANPEVYIVGETSSTNLPVGGQTGPQATAGGGIDGFIVSLTTAAGATGRVMSYLAGTGSDYATDVVATGDGNASARMYVSGYTNSTTFPLATTAPLRVGDSTNGGGYDAFMVEVFDNSPSIYHYATFLGGSGTDYANAIALDTNLPNDGAGWAQVVLTGSTTSPDFPSSVTALNSTPLGATDAFATKLDTAFAGVASSVLFSTYVGGAGSDVGRGIALDAASNVYITGETNTAGAVSAFVNKLNSTGSASPLSIIFGGSGSEVGYAIALDAKKNIYVAGATTSSNFVASGVPATQSVLAGSTDAFVTRFGQGGNVLYSTYLGGSGVDAAYSLAVNTVGATSDVAQTSVYVVGSTASTNFTTVSPSQASNVGATDAFFTKFNNASGVLAYPSEVGYVTNGLNSDYGNLETGTATTVFTYKVVYTHADNVSPNLDPDSPITVCIDAGTSAVCPTTNSYTMYLDTTAASAALRDGSYANGEQFYYTTNLAVGSHNYFFQANDGITSVRLPTGTSSIANPTVSAMTITTTALASAQKTQAYSATLTGSGGTSPTWSIVGLPASLVVSAGGVISGTPQIQNNQTLDTTTQYFPLEVYLTDATGRYTAEIPLAVRPQSDVVAPAQPTGLTTTPGAGQVTLNWTTPYDYYGVTQYQAWRYITASGVGSSAVVGTTTVRPGIDLATSFTNTGLTTSTNYTFAVRARDAAGNWSVYSSAVAESTLTLATMPLGEAADSSLTLTSSGDALWYVQSAVYYPGGFGLNTAPQSGGSSVPITHNQSTSLSATVSGPGTLSFQWKVSSEFEFDFLRFYLDGTEVATAPAISGEIDWTAVGVAIPASGHTVTWTYAKDGGESVGSDAAWIDHVVYTPVETTKVAAGKYHTLTINADGTLWAWGDNTYGQLGLGSNCTDTPLSNTTFCRDPVQIGTGYREVAAGANHTLAIKTDGTLWAWGRNNNGQLGDGTLVNKSRPVKIGTATGWSGVAAGELHSIAMSGVAGSAVAYTWGDNTYGQLGIQAGTTNRQGVTTFATASAVSPTLVSGGFANYRSIAAGAYHNAAVRADGTLRAWGRNNHGQVGDGTYIPKGVPTQVGTSTAWRSVAAGEFHTVADRVDNALYAWGDNGQGQLGIGSTVEKLTPTRVGSETYKAVEAGNSHSVAIKTDGTVWTWGGNVFGQLGDETVTQRNSPVQAGAAGNLTAIGVAAGFGHTLVVKPDGTLWAWGHNGYGQLGNGSLTWGNVPIPITTAGRADKQAPTVPTGWAIAASGVNSILSWNASTDNVAVTLYKIYRNGSFLANDTASPYTDGSPPANSTYTIAACDALGNCSAQTAAVGLDVTAPSVPGVAVATVLSNLEIYMTWTASTDAVGVTRYDIYQSLPVITASNVGSSTTNSFTATNLNANTAYQYKVRACDAAGNCSAIQATASTSKTTLASADITAPTVPGSVSAVAASTTITVSWTAASDTGSPATGLKEYRVYRNDGAVAISSVAASPYADTGRRLDSTYRYTVAACDWAGNCASTSSVSATTTSTGSIALSTALDNATLTYIRSGSASWYGSSVAAAVGGSAAMSGELGHAESSVPITSILTASGISGPGTLSFKSKISSEPGQDFLAFRMDGAQVVGIPDISGEVGWTTYSATVYSGGAHSAVWTYSKNSSGSAGSDAAWVDQIVFVSSVLDTQAPTVPSGVSATVISGSQIDLSWTSSTDDTDVTGYQIFQASPVIASSMVGSSVTNSFSHTGLSNNTAYRYQVRARDAANNWSALSASSVAVTTPVTDVTAPTAPTAVSAVAASSSQIYLSWTASSDAVGVTRYEISRYLTASGISASAVVGVINGTPPVTTFINLVGLEPSTNYTYLIRARDAAGNWSALSTGVSASTSALESTNVDLLMTAQGVTPTSNVAPGTNLTLTSTLKNQGTSAMTASRSYIFFYLSTDATITSADTMIGYRLVTTSLAASAVSSGTSTVRLPSTLNSGTYYIGAIADALNQQVESNESNNSSGPVVAISIVTPSVDLVMSATSATPTTVVPGGSLTLNGTLKNQGAATMTVNSSTVGYYLSTDTTITTADTLLGSRQVDTALAAGASSVLQPLSVTLPAAVTSGSYYLGAIADRLGQQPESNESNNATLAASAIPITVSAQAVNLQLTAVSGTPSSMVVGSSFTLTDTVTNAGSSAMTANRIYVGYYLSPSSAVVTASSVPTTDTRIGFRLVNTSLAASGVSTGTTVVTIPTSMAAGTYYIRAMADVLGQQGESNETDNIRTNTSAITITVPAVDLTMNIVSAVPTVTSIARGSSFTINTTETKTGASAMTVYTHYVFYYLSTDNTITTADTRIGYRAISPGLGAGAQSSAVTGSVVTVPTSLTPGTYYLGAIADGLNQQPETNESNNALTGAAITVY